MGQVVGLIIGKPENSLFRVENLETWKMKYWVRLETGIENLGFETQEN